MKIKRHATAHKSIKILSTVLMLLFTTTSVWAGGESLGTMADTLTATFSSVGSAITGLSYVAGLAFAIAAISQFKQHKENPSQTPIGKPISHLLIAAALLFLPSIFTAVGNTIFSEGGKTAGPTGTEITGSS